MTDRVAVVGLGAMGLGMAQNLLRAGFAVAGYDLSQEARAAFAAAGGEIAASAGAAAEGASLLLLMVVNAEQVESILFGAERAAERLRPGGVVMISSTIPPAAARALGLRVAEMGRLPLDAPVSGGAIGAEEGRLTIMASGPAAAFEKAEKVLAAVARQVYRLGDEPGLGSTYKTVHQLAAGVHLAVAAEVMAFGVRAGCDPERLFEIITNAAGSSWMFGNRVPHMLDEDYRPRSAVEIFVKDLGLVLETGKAERFPLPLAAAAHQLFLAASAAGYGREDDAAVVKVYERLSGVSVKRRAKG